MSSRILKKHFEKIKWKKDTKQREVIVNSKSKYLWSKHNMEGDQQIFS